MVRIASNDFALAASGGNSAARCRQDGHCRRLRLASRAVPRAVLVVVLALTVAGCAGSVAPPDVITAMPKETTYENYGKLTVAATTTASVAMKDEDKKRICDLIETKMGERFPQYFKAADKSQSIIIDIEFIQYDEGNAFARAMLAGLGQIHIEAKVTISEQATRKLLGQYKVAKQFAFGGLIGAATTIKDVEDGFASSVVDLFDKKAS